MINDEKGVTFKGVLLRIASFLKPKKDTDMTQGSIIMQLLTFSVPMMLGLLFQQLYSTVDALVVGKFVGPVALAAVGCNSSLINTVVGTFAGLATGASVVISQAYGAHDDDALSRAVHTTIAMTFILCLAGTAIGLIAAEPLLKLSNLTDPDVKREALKYLRIYFAGVSGLMIYNMGTGILRAVGDSTRPVLFLIISAIINTVLDLLFVLAFKMEVAGVALATIISQLISAVLVLVTLLKSNDAYCLRLSKLRLHKDMIKRIVALGLPASIQSAITSFSNVFVQSYINSLNTYGIAGWTAYNRLDAFLVVPVQAIAMASTTLVAQNWGAGKYKRAKEGTNKAILLSVGVTVFLSVFMVLLAEPLVGIFAKKSDEGYVEVIRHGAYFVRVITPFYFTICFNQIYAGALRGIGKSVAPTVIMLSSFVVFRQIYLFIFGRLLYKGSELVIALAYPLGWTVCSILLIIFYLSSELAKGRSDDMKLSPADTENT
ncbi:MAG: MATE family efflux transporter [Clostridia bacterium]|nr:MATE family efflux transporter [Clostridia bacterium]